MNGTDSIMLNEGYLNR